jgi:putative membrane protein
MQNNNWYEKVKLREENKMKKRLISLALLSTITIMYTLPVFATTKTETVYTKLNNKGEQYKTIVSAKLQNDEKLSTIEDISTLLNIENTSGDETFTNTNNTVIWNANGNDISYQGETENKIPVTMSINYTLDGKEIEPKDLIGKSGKVNIKIEYTNNDVHYVKVNGTTEKMYTPFVVTLGTIIDNKNNENIEVTNGKAINDGTRTIIAGIAMPGLQESLNINKSDLEIPTSVEISMDTKDFELSNIISYITPKIIEESDLDVFDKLDDLYSKTNTLQESSSKLVEGTTTLATNTKKLSIGANQLQIGINTANVGTNKIKSQVDNSVNLLKNDATPAIDQQTLLAIGNQAQQKAILTDTQKIQISTNAANAVVLTEGQKGEIAANAAKGANLSNEQKSTIAANAAKGANLSNEQKSTIAANAANSVIQSDQYKNLTDQEKTTIGQMLINVAEQTAITTAQQTATDTAKQVSVATAQQTAIDTAKQVSVATAQQTAIDTAKKVSVATAQQTATDTAKQTAMSTASQVATNAKQTFTTRTIKDLTTLSNGLGELSTGIGTINNGVSQVATGSEQLSQGAETLENGMKQFDKEGIQTICNYINNNVKTLTGRMKALKDLANDYNNFAGINNNTKGTVKFIVITDALKKDN